MSDVDLQRIETVLAIALPEVYKQHVRAFPIPYLRGNADTELWDDAEHLIRRNQELRADASAPWPSRWYFMGDPLTACAYAIDLHKPVAEVHWVDHCDLRSIQGSPGQPFVDWVRDWSEAHRASLENDGIDPNGPPSLPRIAWPSWKRLLAFSAFALLFVIIIGFGAVQFLEFLRKHFAH